MIDLSVARILTISAEVARKVLRKEDEQLVPQTIIRFRYDYIIFLTNVLNINTTCVQGYYLHLPILCLVRVNLFRPSKLPID